MNLSAPIMMAVAFFLGSIPTGLIVFRRARGGDIRKLGSGNVGASNVFREGGARLGLLTLFFDMAKGLAATLLARIAFADNPFVAEASAFAAAAGHIFSPWLRFRGGKGASTAAGGNLVLHPAAVVLAFAVFSVVAFGTRYASLGTVVAALVFAIGAAISAADIGSVLMAAATAALILWSHRENMKRLLRGEEPVIKPPGESR